LSLAKRVVQLSKYGNNRTTLQRSRVGYIVFVTTIGSTCRKINVTAMFFVAYWTIHWHVSLQSLSSPLDWMLHGLVSLWKWFTKKFSLDEICKNLHFDIIPSSTDRGLVFSESRLIPDYNWFERFVGVRWMNWIGSLKMRNVSSWNRVREQLRLAVAVVLDLETTRTIGQKPRYRCSSRQSTCFPQEQTRGRIHSDHSVAESVIQLAEIL